MLRVLVLDRVKLSLSRGLISGDLPVPVRYADIVSAFVFADIWSIPPVSV